MTLSKIAQRTIAKGFVFFAMIFGIASESIYAQITLPASQYLGVVAGGGTAYPGNGVLATSVALNSPNDVASDASGNLYIADTWNYVVRKVAASTGITTIVAGTFMTQGYSGDKGPAASAELSFPEGVAVDTSGNIYIADVGNNRIRVVYASGTIPNVSNPTVGDIYTVAGNGSSGFSGDTGPATSAKLHLNTSVNTLVKVAVDTSGNIYIADLGNNRIRKVAASTGIISTVAGNGSAGFSGDTGPAINAKLNQPVGLAVDASGNIYIADQANNRVRKVTISTGIISTVAGNGTETVGHVNNGIPATSAQFLGVNGVAVDVLGNIYIAELGNNSGGQQIYQVLATTGIINAVAGNGSRTNYYDAGFLATRSSLNYPYGMAVDGSGNIYFADNGAILAVGSLLTRSVLYPLYEVTSIVYAPPGNKSQDGYTTTTTNGTTTTIGSSFANASSLTFTYGISAWGVGGSVSQTFGVSESTSNSTAFQESFSDATGVANQSNTSSPDAINHNQDLFLIWLNPQVTVTLENVLPAGLIPSAYSINTVESVLPDIVPIYANVMEANSLGVSTVPATWLNQQDTPSGYEPGLAAICKNLIQAEYAAGTCTLADQCGCTPADFAPILALDPLLFYNGTTNPISPYPGTVSPLEANTSTASFSDADCGVLPTPALDKSNCRYVPVPSLPGSPLQAAPFLSGPDSAGGNNVPNSFQQGENQQTTQTLGGQTGESVGVSFKEGSPVFSLTEADTMTWTQSQSVGTANGSGYVQAVTLNTSTVGCGQDIFLFEDTVYHTFVFQQPAGNTSCTTAMATPTFSPVAGTYAAAQTVAISDAASGVTIYYTTNGTTPTTSSTKYTGPITVSSTETVKAIAVASGWANSATGSATYTIQ
jgi:sugar lactone lactonase YvrE